MFKNIYKGKNVFITGMSGFKGSWLATWLTKLGAEVFGYSLAPDTEPSHFNLLKREFRHTEGDVRALDFVTAALRRSNADIVFHLAAQPLVRASYDHPAETFATNVMGTVNVLEACRSIDTVKAVVIVSSDKCYENREILQGYKECDPMGGRDPYSASKGCTELVVNSYRDSFFNIEAYGNKHNTLIASARAGNVIGGGDWAADRLVPDIIRAFVDKREVVIRNPLSIRPWQHVLEPLSGYMFLGQKLLEGRREFASGWNFGPALQDTLTVREVVETACHYFSNVECKFLESHNEPHEANLLRLDCSKANSLLGWKPTWTSKEAIEYTSEWYLEFYNNRILKTNNDIDMYINDAKQLERLWTI